MKRRITRYLPALLALGAGVGALLATHGGRGRSTPPATRSVMIHPRPAPGGAGLPVAHPPEAPARTLEAFAAAHPGELLLRFPDEAGYLDFLATPLPDAVRLLDQLDPLQAVRLHYDDWDRVTALLEELGYEGFDPVPTSPGFSVRGDGVDAGALGFSNSTLDWLGVRSDPSDWGAGVRIAVLDSGVVPHPELPRGIRSLAIEPFPERFAETCPHGTSVASIIAGQGPRVQGLAPAAELVSIRILDDSGRTDGFNVAAGVLAAIEARVHLINLSIGSLEGTSLEADAIRLAQQAGIVVVAAAGNDGFDRLRYPAAYPGVISVGAVDAGGERMKFSNTGPNLSLTAPGVAVLAAAPGDSHALASGTSSSAPIVTAAIAATMSDGSGRFLGAREAAAIVLEHCDDIGPGGPDPEYGAGILNLNRILSRNTPGIVDACLTDQRLVEGGNGAASLVVTVENRGTVPLANSLVRLDGNPALRRVSIPLLRPNESRTIAFPLPPSTLARGARFRFDASLELAGGLRVSRPDGQHLRLEGRVP